MATFHIPLWFGMGAMTAVFVLCLFRGGSEERSIISVMLVAWFVTYVTRDRSSWPALQWGALVADIVGFILILAIALRSRRFWPLYACAFQLLSLITSSMPLFDDSLRSWTLITANIVWTYCLLASIVWGCVFCRPVPAKVCDRRSPQSIRTKPKGLYLAPTLRPRTA